MFQVKGPLLSVCLVVASGLALVTVVPAASACHPSAQLGEPDERGPYLFYSQPCDHTSATVCAGLAPNAVTCAHVDAKDPGATVQTHACELHIDAAWSVLVPSIVASARVGCAGLGAPGS